MYLYNTQRHAAPTFLSSGFMGCSSDTALAPRLMPKGRLMKLGPKFARTLA